MNNLITPNPILPVASEIEENVITLTISEVDRQTAKDYVDSGGCLIYTALRNRGFCVTSVGPIFVSMDDHFDWELDCGVEPIDDLNWIPFATFAPFYGPSVVGKVIRLRKVK